MKLRRIVSAAVHRVEQSAAGRQLRRGCKSRANDDGGTVVFEQVKGTTVLSASSRGSGQRVHRGAAGREAGSLVCLTGHIGQGYLEGGVAQMRSRATRQGVSIKYDFLLRATDSTGAMAPTS